MEDDDVTARFDGEGDSTNSTPGLVACVELPLGQNGRLPGFYESELRWDPKAGADKERGDSRATVDARLTRLARKCEYVRKPTEAEDKEDELDPEAKVARVRGRCGIYLIEVACAV